MNKYILLVLFLLGGDATAQRVSGVYRLHMGMREGYNVWIVDGAAVRRDLYPAFLYGGNPQRYLFIPHNEIWIDNAIAAEEFEYTIAHEFLERSLMARRGMSYDDAHNRALELEHTMRRADDSLARAHERELPHVSPTDCDGVKEIAELPDSIALRNIYRVPLGNRGDISIWIVDGAAVRRDIYPDFGLSDNDLACHFIPANEIWIDGQISCEETEFSIATEMYERELMAKGVPYDDAYERATTAIGASRKKAADSARRKPSLLIPKVLDRDKGTGDEK
jgi:hypothetical protein